jgi:hypothetical protein
MDLLARHASGGRRRRRSLLICATIVAALTIAVAAFAPASSFGVEPPSVSSVSPAGGALAGGTSVDIKGSRFTGTTAVKFGSANATSFTVVSGNRITASSPAGAGTVDVTVTTPSGTSATGPADRFTYGPNVTSVSPNRGPSSGATSVTVSGTDLAGATAVDFGATPATSFKVNSQNSITAVSPEGSGTVDVRVVDPEATSAASAADQFSYVFPPTVVSVSPAGGPEEGGTEVTITVTGTEPNEVTAVHFGMSSASFFANNEGSITAFSPPGVGVVDITVTAFGGTSLTSFADQFRYVPPPTVTSVSPATGSSSGGTSVTITGTNLDEPSAVSFGAADASSVLVNSENSITATAPAGTPGATVDVTVTTLGGTTATSAADQFRYLQNAPLLVSQVSPSTGGLSGATTVAITGSAFVGATAVHFGSTSATSFTVTAQHKIKAIAPAGTGTVDVTVTTPEGTSPTSSADQFSYVPILPVVESISPSEGHEQGGTKVKIKGTGFVGATQVGFGSAPARSFVVNAKGTAIIAVAPSAEAAGQATVDVTVTTPEGTSALSPADRFTYELLAPIVTGISVRKGPAAGGTTVGISGKSFVAVTSVEFGSVAAASYTVNSGGSITATSPAETVGKVKVTVTTPAGVSGPGECEVYTGEGSELAPCPSRELFTFLEPTVTSVTPNGGPASGGTAVTITGTGFAVGTNATQFKFGATPLATSVECSSITTCTAVAPARSAGTVDVRAKVLETGVGASPPNPPADQFTYN